MTVVEGDRAAAEMLHMFFRLMEVECSLIGPDCDVAPTVRRLQPDLLILDLDLPDLRALDIASQARRARPSLPIIFLTDHDTHAPYGAPVMRKPRERFEELLRLFEMVLAMATGP